MRRLVLSALCFTLAVLLAGVGSAEAQPLRVTYVGNAGVLVQMGKKKILIDGCFRGFAGAYLLPQAIQDKLAKAEAPFDGIDLILTTHAHGDHFDSELVRQHLQSNPKAVFASTRQATAPLMDLQGRVLTFEEFRAYNLPEKKLDVAFIQHYCLLGDASDRRLVREGIGARRIIPSHYHLTDPPLRIAAVLGHYQDAVFFQQEMDTWMDFRNAQDTDAGHRAKPLQEGRRTEENVAQCVRQIQP